MQYARAINLFPCLVTAPDGQVFHTCRVHSDASGTRVWWWDRDLRDARVVVESLHEPERRTPGGREYELAMGDSAPAQIRHLTSCGCGHPMKRWQLPKPVREGT